MEDRQEDADVSVLVAAAVDVVVEDDVAVVKVVAEVLDDPLQRRLSAVGDDRGVLGLGERAAAAVEDHRHEIADLVEDRRPRGAHQHGRHLVGDRLHAALQDGGEDRVCAGHGRIRPQRPVDVQTPSAVGHMHRLLQQGDPDLAAGRERRDGMADALKRHLADHPRSRAGMHVVLGRSLQPQTPSPMVRWRRRSGGAWATSTRPWNRDSSAGHVAMSRRQTMGPEWDHELACDGLQGHASLSRAFAAKREDPSGCRDLHARTASRLERRTRLELATLSLGS